MSEDFILSGNPELWMWSISEQFNDSMSSIRCYEQYLLLGRAWVPELRQVDREHASRQESHGRC